MPSCLPLRFSVYVALASAHLGLSPGCGGDSAAVIEVRADDLVVPTELTSFCLAAYDDDDGGGEFARHYLFDDTLTELPQTLTIEPGSAGSARAVARGYRSGVEVARDQAALEFDGVQDISLSLSRCPVADGQNVAVAGTADAGGAAGVATSFGRGGSRIVAVGAGVAASFRASGAGLELDDAPIPEAPTLAPSVVAAFDADGDCDDDVFIGEEGGGARLWLRVSDGFELASSAFLGAPSSARAAAFADTDLDGDIDVVIGDATSLTLWLNDGAGRFTATPGRISTDASSDVTALAFVELDGDGVAELVVARGREAPAPVRVLAAQGGGLGQVDAAAPEAPLSVVGIAVRDFDGDRVDDVALAVAGEATRVFAGRDGRLEDRSFLYFPNGPPLDATGLAIADWDGDCLGDLVVSTSTGDVETYRGSEAGFALEGQGPAGVVSEFADVDDDGDFDAVVVGDQGVITWLAR